MSSSQRSGNEAVNPLMALRMKQAPPASTPSPSPPMGKPPVTEAEAEAETEEDALAQPAMMNPLMALRRSGSVKKQRRESSTSNPLLAAMAAKKQ